MGSQGPVTQEGLHDSEEDLNIELSDNEAEDVHLRPSAGSGTAIIEKVASQAPGESRSEQPQTQSDSFEGEPAWKKAELDEAELDIEVIVSEDEESDTATEIKHEAATSADNAMLGPFSDQESDPQTPELDESFEQGNAAGEEGEESTSGEAGKAASKSKKKRTGPGWGSTGKYKKKAKQVDEQPARSLEGLRLDQLEPFELQSVLTLRQARQGLGMMRRTLVLDHPPVSAPPYKGNVVAFLETSLAAAWQKRPRVFLGKHFAALASILASISMILPIQAAEKEAAFLHKNKELCKTILDVCVEGLLTVTAARDGVEGPVSGSNTDPGDLLEVSWSLVQVLNNFVVGFEYPMKKQQRTFSADLVAHRLLLAVVGALLRMIGKEETRPGGASRLIAVKVGDLLGEFITGNLCSEDMKRTLRQTMTAHECLPALLRSLVGRTSRRDGSTARASRTLLGLATSKKFCRVVASSAPMDEIRESIVSLGLGGASQVALGTGQEHSLNLLLLLNQLLVNEDARFSVLCRLTLRDLFLESATQLMKNWERLVQHVEEVEEDNNGALAYRLIQFFRLYARLAGDEPLPLAAVLFGKFGGTEVGRERLFIHVYSLLQCSCVSKLLSSLDATDTDRRDAAALKSLADTLENREAVMDYISNGSHARSAKEMEEQLQRLQDTDIQIADKNISFKEASDLGLALMQQGKCVSVVGPENEQHFGPNYERYLSRMRRKGTGETPTPFVMLCRNVYLHRKYARLKAEDVPVCRCLARPGKPGCLESSCVLRETKVECTPGFCPCGEDCSNMRFQKCQFARTKVRHAGKERGWGLYAGEHIAAGRLVIEYMGEVCNRRTYDVRRKRYDKELHTYWMVLNTDPQWEVLDASRKSTLGRFLNHSCAPNCETQRWRSLGETVVGIFALRDVKKGEELTFDYQMFDGASKRDCCCGAPKCKGYLGS